jgi:hypothetical protein
MALIKCKECGKEISDTAFLCPYCGIYGAQKNPGRLEMIIFSFLALAFIFVFSSLVYHSYKLIRSLF